MSNNTNVTMTSKIDLPSAGKFPNVPPTITLRAMSLLDEKRRLASTGVRGIVDLINACVIEPEGFDAAKMCRFDLDYAMIALRAVSHGNGYKVSVLCPHCRKTQDRVLDLAAIPCKPVDDSFQYSFEITLPVKGDTLLVHILSYEELENMESEAQKILRKFPDYKGDPTDVLDYTYKIDAVNGEKMAFPILKAYVEQLSAADSIYFDEIYEERLGNFGLDTNITFECDNCKNTFTRQMPINSEFFRPRYHTI